MSDSILDADGQPPRALYYNRAVARQIQEMLGLVKGMVCDGDLSEGEVRSFRNWLEVNPDVSSRWPGRELARRIVRALDDGKIDEAERHDLYELFCDTAGDGGERSLERPFSTKLPFDDPPPPIVFDGRLFCFTGIFAFGSREECERAVIERGGRCHKTIVKKPMTVVVGLMASDAWVQTGWGRKIEKAIVYRDGGVGVQLVGEGHWVQAVNPH